MAKERAERTDASPAAVVGFLEGIAYPCSKAQILEYAAQQGAPRMVIEALELLPEEVYYDLAHLMDRFSGVSP